QGGSAGSSHSSPALRPRVHSPSKHTRELHSLPLVHGLLSASGRLSHSRVSSWLQKPEAHCSALSHSSPRLSGGVAQRPAIHAPDEHSAAELQVAPSVFSAMQ